MKPAGSLLIPIAAILCLTVFAPGDASWAAHREGQFSVSPVIGGISFDGAQHLETRPFYGIRGGYNFTRHLGVEALFDYASTESTKGFGHVDVYRYGGELLYHFFPDNTLVPYVAAGYSGINFDGQSRSIVKNTRGAFDYGLGLKYYISDNIAVRGDVRHLIYKYNQSLHAIEYSVGLLFPFGGTQPAAQAMEQPALPPPVEPVAQPPLQDSPPAAISTREPAPGRFKYCITLKMDFDIDQAIIRQEYHDEIAKVGDFMKSYPSTTALIEGHTDNVGDDDYNMKLSQRRAESVVEYLVKNFGIERTRLAAKGFGETRPIADNASDGGKQKNRRIEAIIDCAFDVREIKPPDTLCMLLNIEFETGTADIKTKYDREIGKIGEYMKKYPSTTALIEGHTDNTGGFEYNMKLSQRRAERVVEYLVKNFGIERSRLSAKGYGFTRNIAYNNTPEGRQKNRRINAIIDCVIKK